MHLFKVFERILHVLFMNLKYYDIRSFLLFCNSLDCDLRLDLSKKHSV